MWELIEKEHREAKIPFENIFVGGFSQGGVISLFTGISKSFQQEKSLGGIIALSSYLTLRNYIMPSNSSLTLMVPIFLGHGTADGVVPFRWGQECYSVLQQNNFIVRFKTYSGMDHSVCADELEDIANFIEDCLLNRIKANDCMNNQKTEL